MKTRTKIVTQVAVTFLTTFFMSILLLKIGSDINFNNTWASAEDDFDVNYFNFVLAAIPALLLIWLWNVEKISKARRNVIVGLVSLLVIGVIGFSLTDLINVGRFDTGTFSYAEDGEKSTIIIETIFIAASIFLSLVYVKGINLLAVKPINKIKSISLIVVSTILCLCFVIVSNWGLTYGEPVGKAKTVEEYSPIFKQGYDVQQGYVNVLKTNCAINSSDETESVGTDFDLLQNYETIENHQKYNAGVAYTYFAETNCFENFSSITEELNKRNSKVVYQLSSTENTNRCMALLEDNKWFTKDDNNQELVSEQFPCALEDYNQIKVIVFDSKRENAFLDILITKEFAYVVTYVESLELSPLEQIPSDVGSEIELYEHGYRF